MRKDLAGENKNRAQPSLSPVSLPQTMKNGYFSSWSSSEGAPTATPTGSVALGASTAGSGVAIVSTFGSSAFGGWKPESCRERRRDWRGADELVGRSASWHPAFAGLPGFDLAGAVGGFDNSRYAAVDIRGTGNNSFRGSLSNWVFAWS